ncbi:MAG: transposase [Gammaproteobacteria bacterium]|nr:transposase [Gammaproteobacteria bacterium]
MRQYIRDRTAGATYFFTINLLNRQSNLLVEHITALRAAYNSTQKSMPFTLHAMVVLPDHLHMLLTLPENDVNYPQRISQMKSRFSRALPEIENINESRQHKGERGIWQRRYWEHRIRDELDYQRHMDYIHYNPVKHGYVNAAKDWSYSTFHQCVRDGIYAEDWAAQDDFGVIGKNDA